MSPSPQGPVSPRVPLPPALQQAGPEAVQALLLMALGVSLFPLLNASVKFLAADYPVSQVIWARFAGHFAFVVLAFMPALGWRLFATGALKLQLARATLLLGSTCLYVSALVFLPLAVASSISFAAPLIVTALSVPLLGEQVGWRRWSAVAAGFAGVLVIIRPGFDVMHPAAFLVVGSATVYALYQILTRRIGPVDRAETTIAYSALVGAVAMSLVLPLDFRLPASLRDWLLFAAIGFFGGFGHYFVVKAFQRGAAALVSPVGYLELLGATLLGYLVFGNLPDRWTWAGAGLIIASGVYTIYRETVRRRAA